MKNFGIKFLVVIFSLFSLFGCIQEIEQFGGGLTPLIVTGELTDESGPHQVRLLFQEGFNVRPDFQKVDGVDVRIIDDLGNEEQLSQIGNGFFETSEDFSGTIGRSYHLKLVFPDESIYESDPELMLPTPALEKIHSVPNEFNEMQYFVDFTDPEGLNNFYRWRYKGTYEVFSDYAGERFGGGDFGTPRNRSCYPANIFGNPFAQCWVNDFDISFLKVENDQLFNGRFVDKKLIYSHGIDIKFDIGYSAEIKLQSLSKRAHKYWSEIQNQLGNKGTIFETANYQILGNVKSISSPEDVVLGYFQVSSVSSIRAFVDTYKGTFPPRDCEPNEGGCRPAYCVSCIAFGTSSTANKPDFWPAD